MLCSFFRLDCQIMLQFTKETNENNIKKGKLCTKMRKFFMKSCTTKKKENLLLKQSATKLVCILYGGKVELYLLEISKMLTKIILKIHKFKKPQKFS